MKPNALLSEDIVYIILVKSDVADAAGNPLDQEPGLPLDPFTARFTTGGIDLQPPCIVDIRPENNAENVPISTTVVARFGEPILQATVNLSTFVLSGPSGSVTGVFLFSDANATVTFQPDEDLSISVSYTITLTTGITDASGNGLDGDCEGAVGPSFTSTFTTGAGGIILNEVIVDPQQDWSDSEGGDGNPFNSIPGSGSITTSDEWIEIYNASSQTFDLNGWSLEMTDTSPEVHIIGAGSGTEILYPPSSTITNFAPGSYLIIGNPVGSNNNACLVALKNASGTIIDKVEIGDDPEGDGEGDGAPEAGADGNADSVSTESISRSPNGFDSDNDINDFVQQTASIGDANNAGSSSNMHPGSFESEPGLTGMSGIAYAGAAPDDPNSLSLLYFVTHTYRGTVYGIDFDDGAYYAFTGIESPMGVCFAPEKDGSGQPLTGRGLLFVTDFSKANIARLRMIPSGEIGNPSTVMVPESSSKDGILFLTFPNMAEPLAAAYSNELETVFIACRGNGYIHECDISGKLLTIFDTGFGSHAIGGIAIGDMGSGEVIFVSHTGGERIDVSDGPSGAIYFFNPHP